MQHDYDITTVDANTGLTFRAAVNAALQALATESSGATEPTTSYPYQRWNDTTNMKRKIRNGANTAWIILGNLDEAEVVNARGTKSTLDQRLDVALNEDGTLKAATTLNPSQWYKPSLTFTYVSTTSFKVNGDQTDIYKSIRRLKINLTASVVYSEVISASFASGPNETTIIILDAVLNNTLVDVEHSLFLPRKDNGAISVKMITNDGGEIAVSDTITNMPAGAYTVTAAQCTGRTTLTNAGAGASSVTSALPVGAANYIIHFNHVDSGNVVIDPNGAQALYVDGVSLGAGVALTSTKKGTRYTLIWDSANSHWEVTYSRTLGAWTTGLTDGVVYTTATDGFVVGFVSNVDSAGIRIYIYSDGANPPTTIRSASGKAPISTGSAIMATFCVPVKKGDNWKISVIDGAINTANINWIPLS